MAGLVQDRHQAGRGVRLVVARGHADVVGHAAAERVQALIEAALGEVEAERAHQPLAERLLRGRRESVPASGSGSAWWAQDALEEVRQESGQRLEQGVDLGGADAGLVAIEERIVGRPAECRGLGCGLLPDEAHDLLERRAQHARNRSAARASRQIISALVVARTRAAIRSAGMAIARRWLRRISRRFAACHGSSPAASCSARSRRSPVSAPVSSSCAIWRSVAICSARTPLPPGGIIT